MQTDNNHVHFLIRQMTPTTHPFLFFIFHSSIFTLLLNLSPSQTFIANHAGLHYVNVDTVKTGGRDRLTLRAFDNKQGPNGDEESLTTTDQPICGMAASGELASCLAKSSPKRYIPCGFDFLTTARAILAVLRSSQVETPTKNRVGLLTSLRPWKNSKPNSVRGLVATWIEGVASGWVRAPQLYLIDKGTLLVQKTRGYGPIYHDCGSKYNDMRERGCNDAIHAFIEALDEFLPFKEYGHLYEKNNPDSWDEDLHMWLGFNIFQEIKVLVRFEYADHKEVSWTAVRNDLDDEDEKGSEKAISAYGRVYDLEYDDDVGYCIGDFGVMNPNLSNAHGYPVSSWWITAPHFMVLPSQTVFATPIGPFSSSIPPRKFPSPPTLPIHYRTIMAKTKSKKRKQAQAQAQSENPRKIAKTTSPSIPTPPPDGTTTHFEPKNLHTVVSEEELEITIDTLNSLAQYPGLIKSKLCKDLRVAVYDFRQACTTGVNNAAGANLTAQVTAALADRKYTEARILLAEMKIRGEQPKLGALCRWVRDLDVISGLSTIPDQQGLVKRSEREETLIKVIDAVLRVCGHEDRNPNAIIQPSSIALQEIWDLRPDAPTEQVYASVLDGSLIASAPESLKKNIRIIETTPGPERKPPNHHDAILYASTPEAVPLSATPPPTTHRPHPVVQGLSVATNVLYPEECKAIIAAGEYVNFVPDAPLREDGDISILAHNFYWVVDKTFHDTLWSRIQPFVPVSMNGRLARGINRRFRVYRYVPGAEYRAHIDGAWPPSGITKEDKYVYDDSPAEKKQSSLFTFLIYLNQDFEGGETTYFLPAAREGILNAYPVRPVMGGAAIFPHGEINATLHEGTGVRKGAKYVIRTEIEYDVEPTEEVQI
ncbi:uncharacterized protein FOBCDRAFT_209215 [Fusarium oxysporum Fo47]|nr:uncharacterized protein FOBCDRAFT_209215 [Fusarium oxysporum Fo47]WJG37274.1 hypothetical protein FOBCDRAFT_209215 [Fusarium oxysporum Fo47]